MTYAEFRRWAWDVHQYRMWNRTSRPEATALFGSQYGVHWNGAGTGTGNPADYGPIHQRRFTCWLRASGLISGAVLQDWLTASEDHEDGWLVNDGSGIRWEADPDPLELVKRGFVAIKCGL